MDFKRENASCHRFPKLVSSKGPEVIRLVGESVRVGCVDDDGGRELLSILVDELLPMVLSDTDIELDTQLLEDVPVMMTRQALFLSTFSKRIFLCFGQDLLLSIEGTTYFLCMVPSPLNMQALS